VGGTTQRMPTLVALRCLRTWSLSCHLWTHQSKVPSRAQLPKMTRLQTCIKHRLMLALMNSCLQKLNMVHMRMGRRPLHCWQQMR